MGHMVINHLYTPSAHSPLSVDALLCVLIEFRIGGILEGMQLESITPDSSCPPAAGYQVSFVRPSDGTWFAINTTSALMVWANDSEDSWGPQTDVDILCHDIQNTLAKMITSYPPAGLKRVTTKTNEHH